MPTFFRRRPQVTASVPIKSASIEATIIRRDGSRIPLGKIATFHRNPLVRAWQQWRLGRRIAGLRRQYPDRLPVDKD